MHYSGKALALPRKTVPLRSGSILWPLVALGIGMSDMIREKLQPPLAPIKGFAREDGKLLRDEGGAAVPLRNEGDAKFKAARTIYLARYNTLVIWHATERPGEITFDAAPPTSEDPTDWQKFADRLYAEMRAGGIAEGEFYAIVQAALRLSRLSAKQLEDAQADFSPTAATPSNESSPQDAVIST